MHLTALLHLCVSESNALYLTFIDFFWNPHSTVITGNYYSMWPYQASLGPAVIFYAKIRRKKSSILSLIWRAPHLPKPLLISYWCCKINDTECTSHLLEISTNSDHELVWCWNMKRRHRDSCRKLKLAVFYVLWVLYLKFYEFYMKCENKMIQEIIRITVTLLKRHLKYFKI